MNPLIQVQSDWYHKLLSEAWFATINIQSQRKWHIEQQINEGLLVTTERNGKMGMGCLIEVPTIGARSSAPHFSGIMRPTVLIAENPTLNTTGLDAEEVAVEVLRTLLPCGLEGMGDFYAPERALDAALDLPESLLGCVAYRVTLEAQLVWDPVSRCAPPSISENAGTITLTNNTADATIYYTVDETFPGPGNDRAVVYQAPFIAPAATVLRWAAYKLNLQGSDIQRATVT